MLLISKEEFMKELGTSEEEQKDLVLLTFNAFKKIQVGDVVYFVDDWDYFIKVPFVVDYAEWLPSPKGVFDRSGKTFFYKQISFIRGYEKRYADSADSNYRNLYVKSSLFEELLKRNNHMKTNTKTELIEATLNQDLKARCGEECFSFEHHDKNFDKVIRHCVGCKFLDDESDFPNRFCDKNNEMIDYWFCTGKCPLGKFELIDKNLNKSEE